MAVVMFGSQGLTALTPWEPAMPNASYFRQKAQRCRDILRTAISPEVREQLRMWVAELESQAKRLARSRRHPIRRPSRSRRRGEVIQGRIS
jgi:hypothetical protein